MDQPQNLFCNGVHRRDRTLPELLGLIRGVLLDGVLTGGEVDALEAYVRANPELLGGFPGNVLYPRLRAVALSRTVPLEELHELRGLLEDTVGEHAGAHDFGAQASSALPLTAPPPPLSFDGVCYVVTGKFLFGPRSMVTAAITSRGGRCDHDVTAHTDVLLVGSLASRDWKHSSFGRKIEQVTELQAAGRRIAIVAEDHWVSQL